MLPALGFLAAGLVLGYALSSPEPAADVSAGAGKTTEAAGREVLYWYDPMYPGTHFGQPGKSPFMDMDLVPRYAGDGDGAGIRIDPAQVQNLAVRTVKAARGSLSFTRDIAANVEFNGYQVAKVQPRAEGFVEKVRSFAVGDAIEEGAPLADITVPTRTTLTLKAPAAGIITSLDVYPGMNVSKDMTIATIQGLDPVWVIANVPEGDLHLVNAESRLRLTVPAYPEEVFPVDSFTLLPRADQDTRTVPLRLSVANPGGLLKPGLTAVIRLRGSGREALLIPTQSLIDLGDEQRVIIRAADGSFVPRLVEVLRSSREQTAITSGLEEGEDVVVSGLFLIDSEANLRGALERMRK
jgi:Cu(I)/Ag(I) efflux system membrane fusion protein